VGIAQRASVAALEFGVVFQRSTVGQCFLFPAFGMYSISTTQPSFDLSSFVDRSAKDVVVEVQWFGTTVAVEAVVCTRIHVNVDSLFDKYLGHRKKENYSKNSNDVQNSKNRE